MEASYLLDTNICVFFLRDKYGIEKKLEEVGVENCVLSEITVGELLFGAYCSKNPVANVALVKQFCSDFPILPIYDSLEEYAKQKYLLRKKGEMIEENDLFIGATAIRKDLILVTDNLKHFTRLKGIKLLNWVER